MAYLQQYGHVVDDTEENSNTDIDDIDVTDDEDSTEVHRDPDDNSDRIQSDLLDTSDINDGDEEGAGANSVVTVHHFLEERALLPEGMRSAPQEEDGRVNQRFRFWDHDSERNEVEWWRSDGGSNPNQSGSTAHANSNTQICIIYIYTKSEVVS